MDVKDLRSDTVLNERNNDGSKYASSVAVPCNSNKLYQDMGQNSVGKVDIPPSRPCAVIGPDRVVPPPVSNETLKKGTYEAWCAENMYRHPPEYPHKISSYQTPIRNISPRQTFQENMQRIMVPPSYNSTKGSEDPNFQEKNVLLSKNIKSNIPLETKYCEVPYNLTNSEQKNSRNTELCAPSVNPVLTRTAPHGWPPHVRPTRTGALPASFGAPEFYQYPEFTNYSGPRPVPINRTHRMVHDESGHVYPDSYSHDGNIRFKPYPTSKERYPQTRYEYISNYPNPFQTPPTFSQQKYDLQKSMPSPYPYPPVPLKYLDSRIVDPSMDGYQRPTPQNNYNLPFRNQIIHPAYGPVLGNCVQNKYPCPTDGSLKPIAPNKLPYDTNKTYVDYENVRNKTFPAPENFYYNEIPRTHHAKSQVMSNYAPVNVHGVPPYPYYRKENLPVKNYEFMPHYRNMDPSFMPMSRIPSQFSPSSIAISPSDSNASNDTTQLQSNSQEDCGYVSQSPTASIRSFDSAINRTDFYRRYESRYGHTLRMSVMSKPEQNSANNMNSKDNKGIDVRQFLQMWNEVDDENGDNSTKDVPQLHANDVNVMASKNQYEIHKNQDQLYVLGLVNVPNEDLSKYEHIQKVSKLPENIKGYNNIELLKQFEEVIESSNVNNFNARISNPRDIGYRPLKGSATHQTPQRPVSPLDVEAKISQSVIHKEVGCNFEIKPCSPKMLNVEVATPVQNVLGERVIEKVTNPLNMVPSILHVEEKIDCNINTHKDHRKPSIKNLEVSSCKMINTSYVANDLVRSNYSLQDLESNSGVCLASLPRLDNDIELNFPEVNQQFINANKGDSVITKINDLPALTLEQSENVLKGNEKSSNPESEMSYEFSPSIVESEREFTKLSKFRKKKIDSEVTELDLSCASSRNIRTDSVIIKNPENTKVIESNKIVFPINPINKSECSQEISSSLSDENDISTKAMELNDEVDLPMENAIDFSIKSDNSNYTSASPLNKFLYDDANQTKKSKSKLQEDTKLCNIENKTDFALSQTNIVIEKLKNNKISLFDKEEENGKSAGPIKDDIKESYEEISNTAREIKTIGSLTEINDHTSVKEPIYDKNVDQTSSDVNNSSINTEDKELVEVKKYNDYSGTELNLDSIITPLQNCNLIFVEESHKYETIVTTNQIERNDANIATSKHKSEDNLNVISSCANEDIEAKNNLVSIQDDSEESDDCTVESDSDSKSSSTSTSIRDDTESEAECTFNESILQSVHHSPPKKQDNTECDNTVTENISFFDRNVNNVLERNKIVEKLNKELLSPRIQNLLTYTEGSTSIQVGTCSKNAHNHITIKDSEGIIETSQSAISSDSNNYEETNSFISNEYDTDMTTKSIQNDCNEKNNNKIIDIKKTVEDLKSFNILHGKNKGTKRKNKTHSDEDSCNNSSKEDHSKDNCSKSTEGSIIIEKNESQEEKKQSKSQNNHTKWHTQSANNFNDLDNSIESFCDKNIDNQVKCVMAYESIKRDTQDSFNLKYIESVFDQNVDKHLKPLNNDIKQNIQFVNNSNVHDNCINSFCGKNTEDQVKCGEIAYNNIKQDTEDVLNFKCMTSTFNENTDKKQKNVEVTHCGIFKNFENENKSNHIHSHDKNVFGKTGENELVSTKLSCINTMENIQDSKNSIKYSENTCSERHDRSNYLNISCNHIKQDNQSVQMIQTSNKNKHCERLDTQDINDVKYTLTNVNFFNKNPVPEMIPKNNHEDGTCKEKEQNSSNYIKSNIYTHEQKQKSIEILRDNSTKKPQYLKHIDSGENYRANICDKNTDLELQFPKILYDDEEENTEQKSVLEEELKSADMLHDVRKENTEKEPMSQQELKSTEILYDNQKENLVKLVLEEELKSAEMLHNVQKENTEKEEDPVIEEELKSSEMYDNQKENTRKDEKPISKGESKFAEMQHDDQKENSEEGNVSKEELTSAEMLPDNQKENTVEPVLEEELKSAETLHDDQKESTEEEEKPVLEEESKFAVMQHDREKNTEEPGLEKELISAEMLPDNQKENTVEPVLEEELKSTETLHDDQKESTEEEEEPVSEEESKFAVMQHDRKKNTEEPGLKKVLKSAEMLHDNQKENTVELVLEEELKSADTLHDDQKESTEEEEEPVSEEESKFAVMQHDREKNTEETGLEKELKSAEMLHDNQKDNTVEPVLEEELKSADTLHDQKESTEEEEEEPVSEEKLKFAIMEYADRKENTEEPGLENELKSLKKITEEPVSEEELKFPEIQHDDRKEDTEESVSEELKSAEMLHDDRKNTDEEHIPEVVVDSIHSAENLNIDITTENYIKKDTLNVTSTVYDANSKNILKQDKIVQKSVDEPNDFVNNNDITKDFPNLTMVTYQQCVKDNNKETEILLSTNDLQPFAYVESSAESSIKENPVKKHRQLKRSLSESALDNLNNDSSDNFNLEWQVKRRKNNLRSFIQPHLLENNFCSIQNNRRNSVSAMYADENLSICILIDDNCIITEEDENSEEQEKICFAEISEDYLCDAQKSANEHEDAGSMTEILLCPQEETNQYSESENIEFIEEKKFDHEDNEYPKKEITDFVEEKSFEESWVEDIACVETVVSEDIAEDVIISAHSSPKELYSPEHEETEVFLNSEHADKVKYIYGDKMCNDDAQFLETLYRTPQMNVNKTLISRESHMSDEFNQFYNTDSLEQMLSQSNSCEDVHTELDALSSNAYQSQCAQIINIKDDKENFGTKNVSPITNKTLFSNDDTNEQKPEYNKIERTQDDTVHSCESSTDNVFSYTQKDDHTKNTISSSPEVSSTTSEEKNSSILLKITNYKGSRMSHVNNTGHETKSISCKFTEVNDYSTSLFNGKNANRPLITKAAQKYIPPLKETIQDLKIRLPLPEHSLLKLKQLKLLKEEPKHNKYLKFSKKELPKKPKPKFEDVLKSIDEIQFQKHKENNKKIKKSIPKVVIKKNENGAHYASTTKKDIFNPDLTGRKWQPWVFLEKNHFIDKMALKNKKIAVYSHRKSMYVLAEKFQKYKSCSTKFVISQPKLDDNSMGQLKCTIRLKHT